MKTKFFFFAMLASVVASAQSTVQITPISATYTSSPTIQFKVSWTSQTTANHRNKIWVFVDFQPVISPTQKGNWQPATVTGTVQKTAGTVSEQSNRGFFLEGTITNFSSTVTVTLSDVTGKFNWCAYGSDYPPNATMNNGTYTLKGTPPFIINTTITENGKSYSGVCITSLTDKTGCPGIINNNFSPGSISTASYSNCVNVSGTATTIATSPTGSGNYNYQWTVSFNNGTAATISGATAATYSPPATATAGTYRYMRQVKDVLCNTAFANSAGTITRTVIALSTRDQTVGCGCASGLIAVGGYCRNLTADEASTYTGCGIEIKKRAVHTTYTAYTCPTGWRLPNETEVTCLYNNQNSLSLNWDSGDHTVWFLNPSTTCGTSYCGGNPGGLTNNVIKSFDGRYCSGTLFTVGSCYRVCGGCGASHICVR
jgi:hypothetical protein